MYTHKHPPSLCSANVNSETTHGSRESRRFRKEHKYTRILYYINTHAGLYKYPVPSVWVSYINTLHMTPSPSPLTGLLAGEGEKRGFKPWALKETTTALWPPRPQGEPSLSQHWPPKASRRKGERIESGMGEALQFFTASPKGGRGDKRSIKKIK